MLKTRERRDNTPDDGTARRCRMCGTTVAVGPDGRCRLGHHVGLPLDPTPATRPAENPQAESPQAESPQAESPQADSGTAALPALPPPPAAQTVARAAPAADPYAHPYDDVLSWDAPQPAPAPATAAPEGPGLRSAIDELLAWDEPAPVSALDVHVDELPPPPPPPSESPAPVRAEFVDEEAEAAQEEVGRRRLATLLGGGAVAMVAGFLAAVVGFPV